MVRPLTPADAPAVADISRRLYSVINASWTEAQFLRLLRTFPEGQVGVEDNGRLVAFAFSLVVDYALYGDEHSYRDITGGFQFTTHDADGDVLYGI